jgi:hypothetical protein
MAFSRRWKKKRSLEEPENNTRQLKENEQLARICEYHQQKRNHSAFQKPECC